MNVENFVPTWLYVKVHLITGMKYFGKTIKDPYKYKGSGKYWIAHMKRHGRDVKTIFAKRFTDPHEMTKFAKIFSDDNRIASSDEWANLNEENGFDGAPVGHKPHKFTDEQKEKISRSSKRAWANKEMRERILLAQKKSWTDERREKQSEYLRTIAWTDERRMSHKEKLTGRKKSDETKKKLRKSHSKEWGMKISVSLKGVKKSEEHKAKLRVKKTRCCRIEDKKEMAVSHFTRQDKSILFIALTLACINKFLMLKEK